MSGDLYNIKKIKIGDIKSPRDISWNKRQLNMKDYIIQNHTDEKLYIKISKDNKIIDGRHRYNILLDEFGNEYEIYVQQMKIDKLTFSIFMYIFLPILLPVGIIFTGFQKIKNLW